MFYLLNYQKKDLFLCFEKVEKIMNSFKIAYCLYLVLFLMFPKWDDNIISNVLPFHLGSVWIVFDGGTASNSSFRIFDQAIAIHGMVSSAVSVSDMITSTSPNNAADIVNDVNAQIKGGTEDNTTISGQLMERPKLDSSYYKTSIIKEISGTFGGISSTNYDAYEWIKDSDTASYRRKGYKLTKTK